MPINTDLNVAPYFDDYNELKNYHRILFRPSTAVQARELTQLQTILQNQIERFGNWAFRNGDIVQGCIISDIPILPYIRLTDFASNGTANTVSLTTLDLVNTVATSVTSGLSAVVLYANSGFTTNYPDTNIVYVKYLNTGSAGETYFSNAELLTFSTVNSTATVAVSNVYTYANSNTSHVSTGNAHGVSVTEGIIFINGNFVRVENATFGLVNNYGTYAGNNVIGFDLIEEIITENQDSSLLDNALGYNNENAPGAHRLKLSPTIVSLDPVVAQNTAGFNPIGVYNFGTLVSKTSSSDLLSVVGEAVSKRTYEESGNYVVNPFIVDTVTNPGTGISAANSGAFLGRVSQGIGYSQGSRVEIEKTAYINLRRGIDTETFEDRLVTFNYGGYVIINEVSGSFDFDQAQEVKIYDTVQKAVSNKTYTNSAPSGNLIGTAKMRCFRYSSGNIGTADALYILHIFNVSLNTGYNIAQAKSLYYDGTNKGIADIYSEGVLNSQNKKQLYGFGVYGVKDLRNGSGNLNTQYYYRKKSSGAIAASLGNCTITITGSATGGNDQVAFGGANGTIMPDLLASNYTVVVTANNESANLTGTVSVTSGSPVITGSGTTFKLNFNIGDSIKVSGDSSTKTIVSITNSTYMTVDANYPSTSSTINYVKFYPKGKILPISTSSGFGPSSYIVFDNPSGFTIETGQVPKTNMPVDVYYDVLRTNVVPAKKDIKKNRFVKINTSSKPNGPWCLGYSDIHKVSKVYGSATSTFANASGIIATDITKDFTYDTGQKDTHYDYGYLYPKSSYGQTTYPYLLVMLDYFKANTSAGMGFFTTESYNIDDVNSANATAIQTKDIPLYIDENGRKNPLRDYIDFRTPSIPTANDTGNITTLANAAQVNTAISYATTNPNTTLNFVIDPTYGLNFPSYSQNLQTDFNLYLPRKDLVIITPEGKLKVKEGVSSLTPQNPLSPDNAMPLAMINVPPYPSLTTDQVDILYPINQASKNLVRDTGSYITSSMVTHRRYTMRDIGKLDQRITNLEYYSQLSILEKKAKDLTVTDENGLDRFKNGFFVDPFSDFSVADVSNQEFSLAIDSKKGIGRPKIIREIVNIQFDQTASTSKVKQTGRLLSLNFSEVPFIDQPNATKYRNAALVAYAWNGTVILIPSHDNNMDQYSTGSININIDNTKPWKDFANSPLAYTWGEWRTTDIQSTSNTFLDGTARTYDIDLGALSGRDWNWSGGTGGGSGSQTFNLETAAGRESAIAVAEELARQQGYDPNLVRGNLTVEYAPGMPEYYQKSEF